MIKETMAIGTQVVYVPLHAHGDKNHKDCEYGFITQDIGKELVFCRFFCNDKYPRGNDAFPPLRTLSNSESVAREHLELHERVLQSYVQGILESLGYASQEKE